MYCCRTDNTGYTFFTHSYLTSKGNSRINASDRCESKCSVIVYICDNEAYFVHVGTYHKLLISCLSALAETYDTAERVNFILAVRCYLADY